MKFNKSKDFQTISKDTQELEKRLNSLSKIIKVTVEESDGIYVDRDPKDGVFVGQKTSKFIQVFIQGKTASGYDNRMLMFTITEPYKERIWWGINIESPINIWVGSNIDFYIKALQLANEFIKEKEKNNDSHQKRS